MVKGAVENLVDLAARGLLSGLLYIVVPVLILLAIDFCASKSKSGLFQIFAIVLVCLEVAMSFMLINSDTGSTIMYYCAMGFSMAAAVFILKFFRYTPLDYAVIAAGFVFIKRFAPDYVFSSVATMLLVFAVILAVTGIRLGKLSGNLFYIWFASLLVSFESYVFDYVFNRIVRQIGYTFSSALAKIAVWGTGVFIVVLLNLVLIYCIKRLLNRYFDEINDMGRRYPRVERYFLYSTIIIFAATGIARFAFKIGDSGVDYSLTFNIFTVFALAIQLSFLTMLYRLTWLRDSLKSKDRENVSLAAYSSGLEKNLDDIRNLKHDIKNIFLTMTNFVEKSGDEDMKAFYRDKINPFADDAIRKSDLYAKLSNAGEERLKAFLFYKISQILERGVALEIEIAPHFNSEADPEFTDLIRILGILLDNAAEECMELQNGTIYVKLSMNDELVSYMIRNSVRPGTRETGIRPGVSSKGDERGRGLVIVRDIIGRYERVSLNSYFSHGEFVQGLSCYRL